MFSFTEPTDNILNYSPWILKKGTDTKTVKVVTGRVQGKAIVAEIEGISDRDIAAALAGWEILVEQSQLPNVVGNEYYWFDLVGLRVENTQGSDFGVVESLMETGANDVLIVKGDRDRAIPFLQGQTIIKIDLDAGLMIVDWDLDF
ncbi:16S rRNA processing protein [Crenothrix polyspora]|uniref:Ribosome maturation factor RimM n=1 Tax=Crenothrix polyspora TaxID=360316 RepID=A0A1R4H347_9GAMM|nr:16S rRNA processing protein [Crenothrix polyspora]